jgi:hypothetical protein
MGKFNIIGILQPGLINARVNGRFQDVELFNASEEVLEQLFQDKNPYVQLTPEEFMLRNPEAQDIKIEPIKVSRKQQATPSPD